MQEAEACTRPLQNHLPVLRHRTTLAGVLMPQYLRRTARPLSSSPPLPPQAPPQVSCSLPQHPLPAQWWPARLPLPPPAEGTPCPLQTFCLLKQDPLTVRCRAIVTDFKLQAGAGSNDRNSLSHCQCWAATCCTSARCAAESR